jgi:glycosyltransferase involved in cell wall biosynthesis
MRVLFLLPYAEETVPGQRFRVEQWIPHLRAHGVTCDASSSLTAAEQRVLYSRKPMAVKAAVLAGSLTRCLRRLPRRGQYDVVWLHRTMLLAGPPLVERLLFRVGTPVIYEFDDAIWLTKTVRANRLWGALKWSSKTATLCKAAAGVVVGNDYLADYARAHNENVWVVPTTVEETPLRQGDEQRPGPVVIGWSGSATTQEDLEHIAGALERVARAADVEFSIIGGEIAIPGARVVCRPWSPEAEVELRRFDVGIMPLPNDPWRRGKCGLKALQYMAEGIPTVASPVGVNTTILQDGENGLLAATEDEWVEKLLRLIADPALRCKLGEGGRSTVETAFTPRVVVPRLVEILDAVARGGAAKPTAVPVA